jgi:hypothetical protein
MSNLIVLKNNSLPCRLNFQAISLLNTSLETRDLDYAITIIEKSLGVNVLIAEFLMQNYHQNYQEKDNFRKESMEYAKNIDSYHSKQMLEAIKFLFSLNSNIALTILSKFDSFR